MMWRRLFSTPSLQWRLVALIVIPTALAWLAASAARPPGR